MSLYLKNKDLFSFNRAKDRFLGTMKPLWHFVFFKLFNHLWYFLIYVVNKLFYIIVQEKYKIIFAEKSIFYSKKIIRKKELWLFVLWLFVCDFLSCDFLSYIHFCRAFDFSRKSETKRSYIPSSAVATSTNIHSVVKVFEILFTKLVNIPYLKKNTKMFLEE